MRAWNHNHIQSFINQSFIHSLIIYYFNHSFTVAIVETYLKASLSGFEVIAEVSAPKARLRCVMYWRESLEHT